MEKDTKLPMMLHLQGDGAESGVVDTNNSRIVGEGGRHLLNFFLRSGTVGGEKSSSTHKGGNGREGVSSQRKLQQSSLVSVVGRGMGYQGTLPVHSLGTQ
jgi:hypothetical protein